MNIASMKNVPLVICGDFTFPFVAWSELALSGTRILYEPCLPSIVDIGFTEHIFECTHIGGNTLDLIFSSERVVRNINIAPSVLSDIS